MRYFILVIAAIIFVLGQSGCASKNYGAREFIPGKGWEPTRN